MSTHLITGYAGREHIKSEDQGSFNASFFGTGQFVMEAGRMMEASIIDNNTVRILDGDILMKGRHIRINPNTYEDVVIDNGAAGVNRCDLIVMEYNKDTTTGIETAGVKVLKGTETTGDATQPIYIEGNILGGETVNQMPLYKVVIKGVVLTEIDCLFEIKPTYERLMEIYKEKFIKDCETHLDSLGIIDTMEEIETNNKEKQLAGALALKELGTKLSATDGTDFRFGVNEKGEYGYIVTKDGADTVIPFSNKAMLVSALQYSGLGITEDSTWDEIYAKLAEAYPEIYSLLMSGWFIDQNSTEVSSIASDTSTVIFEVAGSTTAECFCYSPEFDISRFKSLEIYGTSLRTGNIHTDGYEPKIYLVNSSDGLSTEIYSGGRSDEGVTEIISFAYGIEKLSGKYRIKLRLYNHEDYSTKPNLTLTKIAFVV